MAPAVLTTPRGPDHRRPPMINESVAYVLCRIEDDSSLTPVSRHEDILAGIAAGVYTSAGATSVLPPEPGEDTAVYEAPYARYKELYQRLG